MQLFLIGYIVICICEIFTVGWFPLDNNVRRVSLIMSKPIGHKSNHHQGFTAVHIATIVSTLWILMLNGAVGYQLLDDGTPFSLGLILGSAALFFIGTGYIALDTAFSWTGYWDSTLVFPNRAYALYTLYQLVPLVFLFVFFVLETLLVLRILGERKPMREWPSLYPDLCYVLTSSPVYLITATLLFALGQIFQYLVSVHICTGTNGKINGGLFETLFTLLAVVMIWAFWSSITEDDWPMPVASESTYT
jgi:hypothetical protein